ncbi:hypothetical protein CHU95_20100 [Niveispirillum lacus]|uniref:HK97 gp10 family phage protein n=1 Tax=Niveispirillum lacus TaxID=1981099 RepID=A0A255YQE5_9PROT|nr:hypothetical protein [Niveispirillum lacus]OYQ31456.1 hypothetical protein CHU95_20100 [Niveispirillum lacus]
MIDIRTNAGRVSDALGRMSAKLERVVARGVNDIAKAVQAHVTAQLDVRIDKPTPFTKRAYRIAYAAPGSLIARVFAQELQAAYLIKIETGGTTHVAPGKPLLMPFGQRTNANGNIPRGAISRALARPDAFAGRPGPGSQPGIWRRPKAKRGAAAGRPARSELLIAFLRKRTHKPQLHFTEDARAAAERNTGKVADAIQALVNASIVP